MIFKINAFFRRRAFTHCWLIANDKVPQQYPDQNKKIMPNAGASLRITPTGPQSAGHRAAEREPALKILIAVADSFREIQLLMILFPAALTGPSAIPKRTRTISIVHNPVTKPVKPQNTDHSNAAMRKPFWPNFIAGPATNKIKQGVSDKNALKIIPISAALNPNSFRSRGSYRQC